MVNSYPAMRTTVHEHLTVTIVGLHLSTAFAAMNVWNGFVDNYDDVCPVSLAVDEIDEHVSEFGSNCMVI